YILGAFRWQIIGLCIRGLFEIRGEKPKVPIFFFSPTAQCNFFVCLHGGLQVPSIAIFIGPCRFVLPADPVSICFIFFSSLCCTTARVVGTKSSPYRSKTGQTSSATIPRGGTGNLVRIRNVQLVVSHEVIRYLMLNCPHPGSQWRDFIGRIHRL
ncbi:hypothetical protein PoMZ_06610, partial [Pyricularia oryzae]